MRRLVTPAVLCLFVLAGTTVSAQDYKVKGAELVKPGEQFETLFPQLAALPFDQDEVDFFLGQLEPIEAWGNDNKEAWNSVDDAEDPIAAILGLELWGTLDTCSGEEFVAIFVKLMMAKEISGGNMDKEQIQQQLEMIKGMMDSPDMPEESKADMQEAVEMMEGMLAAAEAFETNGSKEVYDANAEDIDSALERFEEIGEEAEEEEEEDSEPDEAPEKGGMK